MDSLVLSSSVRLEVEQNQLVSAEGSYHVCQSDFGCSGARSVRAALAGLVAGGTQPLDGVPRFSRPQEVDYPEDGVRLGNGWDYDRGSKTAGNCISFHEETDKAQDKTLTFDSVVDQENLADVLDVSLTVRAKALVGESSAKLRFIREVSFTGNHQNIVVRAVVRSGATYTGSSTGSSPGGGLRLDLLPDYARLAAKSPWLFRKECGDFFVSAIHSGGELLAVYSFEQDISKRTETIDASLEGRGFGFEVDSSLAKKLTSNSDQQNLRIFYQQNGGAGNHLPTDVATLLAQVQLLPEAVKDAPKPWRVTLQGYDTLPSWPQGSPSSAMTALDEAVRQYERLLSLYQQVGSILS